MPAPKDLAKMRAREIRQAAAKRLHERFKAKLEELANAHKIGRNKADNPNQQEAADLLGIPQSMVNQLLKGKRVPGADYLAVISEMLGVSSDELLGLPASDLERARRIAFDFLDPVMARRLYEMLKLRFEGAPKELEAADLEVTPHMPEPDLSSESGQQTPDNVAVPATKRQKSRRSKR